MSSRRTQKAAEAIREVVSMAILTELKDPRVRDVTVTHVEVTPDMRQAKIHVSIMGDEKKQKLTLHGLENSAGFLQSKVAKRIDTRYTPRLAFVLDLGVKRSIEIAQILQQVLPKQSTPADVEDAETDETDIGESASDNGDPGDTGTGSPPSATDHG
jgi:ribosome-binding factor A